MTADIFSPSWYVPQEQFTEQQLLYTQLVCDTFNMSNQLREPVPYIPTLYQAEFHSNSINVLLEKAPHILWLKGRGVSFTWSSMTELLMSATTFEDQLFPVVAQREQNSKDINLDGWWLLRHCNVPALRNQFELRGDGMELRNTVTGSVIRAYPSNAASEAIRQKRLIRFLIDEFAFQSRDKELLTAAMYTMRGNTGQGIVGSTPKGRQNYFYELAKNPVGFKKFTLPVFDPTKFNPSVRPSLQHLPPIAPWIDMAKIDEDWERDRIGFMQENMNDFLDDSLALIPYSAIQRRISRTLPNLCEMMERDPTAVYQTNNPITWAMDVAETSDYTAIVAFEHIPIGEKILLVERFIKTIRGMSLPQQKRYIQRVHEFFPTTSRGRIDMTGIGQHIFEEMREDNGAVIEGIDFRRSIKTAQIGVNTKIREFMFTELKNLIETEPQQIALIDHALQTRHIGAIDRSFEIARDPQEGHGDILVSIAMATMDLNFRKRSSTPMYTGRASTLQSHDVHIDAEKIKSNVTKDEVEEYYKSVSWDDHIELLRKGAHKRRNAFG